MTQQNQAEDLSEKVVSIDAAASRRERIDITRAAIREELKAWLDERVRDFAWWSLRRLLLLGFVALMYFILTQHGWKQS